MSPESQDQFRSYSLCQENHKTQEELQIDLQSSCFLCLSELVSEPGSPGKGMNQEVSQIGTGVSTLRSRYGNNFKRSFGTSL